MNDEAAMMFFAMMGVALLSAFGWYRESHKRRRAEERLWGIAAANGLPITVFSETQPIVAARNPRVEQLEAQIETMAQQMDRLAESQEFLSRVLTDRMEQLPDPRLKTPH